MPKKLILTLALVMLFGGAAPAVAEPQGYIAGNLGVGFFYGTFDEDPNLVLVAGGTAEEFCADNPGDPFSAEPGEAPLRTFLRHDGSIDEKVDDNGQPIHLYTNPYESGNAILWIEQVCADAIEADLLASGTAHLKVRNTIWPSEDGPPALVEVFNSVNGFVSGDDGAYKIYAEADLDVVNGVPQGNPEDFVRLDVRKIGS